MSPPLKYLQETCKRSTNLHLRYKFMSLRKLCRSWEIFIQFFHPCLLWLFVVYVVQDSVDAVLLRGMMGSITMSTKLIRTGTRIKEEYTTLEDFKGNYNNSILKKFIAPKLSNNWECSKNKISESSSMLWNPCNILMQIMSFKTQNA